VAAVLWASIGVLALAVALALRLLRRSGEGRVAVLAALAAFAAAGQAALLFQYGDRPLGLDAQSAAALAGLVAAGAALFAVRAFGATLAELELAEALHWGSMQGVRAVTELAADRGGRLEERLASLLELGCERFGLEIGIVSRIRGDRYEVCALRAPEGFPVASGGVLPLGDTVCRHTSAGDRPVAVDRVSEAPWARPPERDPLGLEAYLGVPLASGSRPFGTLVFASRSPSAQRFTASHKDLLALMAQWVSVELERHAAYALREQGREAAAQRGEAERSAGPRDAGREAALQRAVGEGSAGPREASREAPRRPGAAERSAGPRGPRTQTARGPRADESSPPALRLRRSPRRGAPGVDVDEVLRRVERRIRDLVEPRVRLVVRPAGGPARARDAGVPLDSLLLTLVGHAVEAMPTGGTLTLSGANLAGDAERYVTLSVCHTGRGPDAEALARAFDPGRGDTRDRLALSRLVRALRRGGGDLSVDVDPERGATFTVFLPVAAAHSRGRSRTDAAGPEASRAGSPRGA